ncbi:transcriptional regulator, TetR family [Chitinophaga costaii]|uniref:Transcriptional regulator, TetR family n=1 Tax=Chitinophaga costaii TaxID=1335309 RepID=A0A1C4ANX3_9BACT|nr:TetR/AcrR family transcriptional regulator [Chitinophaga costaii]PUZ26686.1 TetR/AcrR family transcriptional regulator [Chitinophaga costaii]SCB96324.1 transcriptional regulator, TetR family [Chitinophaga costaii]
MNVRERILDTALRLFRTYGMKSVTMFDISRECGISKKTVYEHFTDKDALINESIDFLLHQRGSQLTHCSETGANAIAELLEGLQYSEQFAQAINPVMFYELRKYHPDAWARVDAFKQKTTLPAIRKNLDRGVAEGLFHNNLNLDVIARMRQLQMESVYFPEQFPATQYNSHEVMTELTWHYIQGVATLKGMEVAGNYRDLAVAAQ